MTLPPEPLQTSYYDSTLTSYCFCHEMLSSKINKEQFILKIKSQPCFPDSVPVISALNIIECESIQNAEYSKILPQLIAAISELISVTDLKECLDFQTLADAQLIPSPESINQKFVKLKTRMFYKQQKFNLFREESEGYSKLITLLLHLNSNNTYTVSEIKNAICSLIGFFNLDPNRVFDVILESTESNIDDHNIYCDLLHAFNADQSLLSHLLGFKINSQSSLDDNQINTYKVAALLARSNLLSIDDFVCHLQNDVSSMSFDIDATTNSDDKQLSLFLTELVLTDQLEEAIHLILSNPKFQTSSHTLLALAFCNSLQDCVHPLYRLCSTIPLPLYAHISESNSTRSRVVNNWQEFNTLVYPILRIVGSLLYKSPSTFFKLTRIICYFVAYLGNDVTSEQADFETNLNILLTECFLPALSMLEFNEPASLEIWECFKHFSYKKRYNLYKQWIDHSYNLNEQLIAMKVQVLNRSKYIIKRITKENVRNYSRQIAKLSHCNPVIVCQYVSVEVNFL
ncbi:hypothetical protein GJ496_002642 [Pomphorhynchus laevis]|nr:hypothetical protein GJ496_002642 [Pomphorhynchus laevis]